MLRRDDPDGSVRMAQTIQASEIGPDVIYYLGSNFKEAQLGMLRIGQPVTLTSDVYGRKVKFRGTVSGLGAGTGAAFALLPAQNASGNWIKVVQRLPVRIEFDKIPPGLAAGLSAKVKVDVRDRSAPR